MTEGVSGTSRQLYHRPDPLRDEPEEHSWDGEIDRLYAKYGDDPFPTPPDDDELPRRVYNAAERRQENEERVEELMADFEARLEKYR